MTIKTRKFYLKTRKKERPYSKFFILEFQKYTYEYRGIEIFLGDLMISIVYKKTI